MMTFLLLFLAGLPPASAASFNYCRTIFRETPPGYTRSGLPIRRSPVVDIAYEGRGTGHIRLQELTRDGVIYSHPSFAKRSLEALSDPTSEVTLGPKDSLLTLDYRGDLRGHLFQRLVEGTINHATLDVIGITMQPINFKRDNGTLSVSRTMIIIRPKIQDYRDLAKGERPIETREAAVEWLGNQIADVFSKLFVKEVYQALSQHSAVFDKVYDLMSQRPDVPLGHPHSRLTRQEFAQKFNSGLQTLLRELDTADLLYMNKTFWEAKPVATPTSVELFNLASQSGRDSSRSEFVSEYSQRALQLRERLYKKIHHGRFGGRGSLNGGVGETSEFLLRMNVKGSRSQYDTGSAISGMTAQTRFGLDFYANQGMEYQSVRSALEFSDPVVQRIAGKLEKAGYQELVQLEGLDALKLMNGHPHLTIQEIQLLAMDLHPLGVYLSYSNPVYYRMDVQVRQMVAPPKNKTFQYDPRSNRYFKIIDVGD